MPICLYPECTKLVRASQIVCSAHYRVLPPFAQSAVRAAISYLMPPIVRQAAQVVTEAIAAGY